MAEIFLSYRRQDSESATGRLADALEAHFGDDRVLRDREFAAGENFVAAIRRAVESSTVMLVVIGRRWLGASDGGGRRRLDDPADFVRLEIELALAARVGVVPVLVEGAAMPSAGELPLSLGDFSRCQALELSDTRWRYDADRLIETLQSRFAIAADASPLAPSAGSGVALARLASDLLDLALHPKRLIARRQTGRASDQVRALAFFAVAILVGNLVLLVGLDLHVAGAEATASSRLVSSLGWLLNGELAHVLLAVLLVAALSLAWRVTARGAEYRRVGLVAAYIYSGAWIGFCIGALAAGSAVLLIDPGYLDRSAGALWAIASAPAAGASAPALPQLRGLDASPFRGAAMVLMLLGFTTWLATTVWCVAAWGAFRQAFAATRAQAWLATSLCLGFVATLVALAKLLG
jgi:hypothetical protein